MSPAAWKAIDFRKAAWALVVLAAFAAAVFVFVPAGGPLEWTGDLSCVTSREQRIVKGDSLAGLIESGAEVEILFGYYGCNEPRLDDVVAYYYAGAQEPLVKIIKAVPGDTFELFPDGKVWKILVNGTPVISPRDGREYAVNADRYPRLHLYEVDYGKGLPAGTYLLLGTDPEDSFDSRAFGLVDISDILGKVTVP